MKARAIGMVVMAVSMLAGGFSMAAKDYDRYDNGMGRKASIVITIGNKGYDCRECNKRYERAHRAHDRDCCLHGKKRKSCCDDRRLARRVDCRKDRHSDYRDGRCEERRIYRF